MPHNMELHPERPRTLHREPPSHVLTRDAAQQLAALLFDSSTTPFELPRAADLTAAVVGLATASRHKALVPFEDTTEELALVRDGDHVLVSHYDTSSAPEVYQLNHRVRLRTLLEVCAGAAMEAAATEVDRTTRQVAERIAERARRTPVASDAARELPLIERRGGAVSEPRSDVSLAFGFRAHFRPSPGGLAAGGDSLRADVHALLFEGSLWAFVRGRRITLARGPIMLAAQRMVVATRALVEAAEAGRRTNVRLRAGGFHVGVRLDRTGEAAVTLGSDETGSVTAAALDVRSAALPMLRAASDLMRALVSADRSQSRNLRVRALREEVRRLRKQIKSRQPARGFVNEDPDRLRAMAKVDSAASEATAPPPSPQRQGRPAGSLRFSERWRVEVDGLDAAQTFFCGDRLVLATPRYTLAVHRDSGDVLWARETNGATALMAGATLALIGADGHVELCDVDDGEPHATCRVVPRVGGTPYGVYARGQGIPATAVLTEGSRGLVAIDLRNGEPRWRFRAPGAGAYRLRRAGRVLVAVCGDGTVHGLDLATGEIVWRFAEAARFSLRPEVVSDLVVAVAGEPGGQRGELFGLDLYSGQLRFRRSLAGAPATGPVAAHDHFVVPVSGARGPNRLVAFGADGEPTWQTDDPGIGGAALVVDRNLVVNAPGGRLTALDVGTGEHRWAHSLAHPVADEVPRRLEPVLRGGALFVPATSVHVVRPSDGVSLGPALPSDLVPDAIRVDERGWVYVAEESGHIAAYAPVPQLRLIPGGR